MKKILLIEDNKNVRETTADILTLAGYEVLTEESGKAGIQEALSSQPDLIICDIMMPGLDGYGVLHILSKRPETAGIPFIFLTAKSEKADLRKGMNLGADDYLTKPFEEMELLDAVESRLRKSEVIRKEFPQDIDGLNQFYQEASAFKELKDLSKQRELKTFRKNADIFLEGSVCRVLYFVNRGRVKTYKTTKDGKDFVTNILGPGDFLGYMALFEKKGLYTESATALEEVEVCLIPREDFFRLLYKNPDVAGKFIKMLSHNLVEREKQLLQISYHSIRQRVAEALLKLAQPGTKPDFLPIVTMAHKDLAGITGAAKETVTRTLADFKEEGLINMDRMLITILDEKRLQQVTL